MLVRHPAYGLGRIDSLTGYGDQRKATIKFTAGGSAAAEVDHAAVIQHAKDDHQQHHPRGDGDLGTDGDLRVGAGQHQRPPPAGRTAPSQPERTARTWTGTPAPSASTTRPRPATIATCRRDGPELR